MLEEKRGLIFCPDRNIQVYFNTHEKVIVHLSGGLEVDKVLVSYFTLYHYLLADNMYMNP